MVTQFNQLDKVGVIALPYSQTLPVMVSGSTYTGLLQPAPILDSSNNGVAGFRNKSFSATGSVFVNEVNREDLVVADGDYYINYASGYYKVKAGASATPVASFYYKSQVSSNEKSPLIANSTLLRSSGTSLAVGDTLGTSYAVSAIDGVAAVAQEVVETLSGITDGEITITVDDVDYTTDFDTDSATTATAFYTEHVAALLTAGIILTNPSSAALKFKANVAGTPFTLVATDAGTDGTWTPSGVVANVVSTLGGTVTMTIGTHTLTVGQFYAGTIASVGGCTNANGDFRLLPISTTKVEVYQQDEITPVLTNAVYTSGGTVALLHRFRNIFNRNGGTADITQIRTRIETNAAISTVFRYYFYKTQPSATLDDAVKPDLKANELKSCGYYDVRVENTFPSGSDVVLSCDSAMAKPIAADANSKDLFAQVVTLSAITLQASKTIFIEITAKQ